MLINIYSIGLFIVKCKQILLCIKHYYIEIICRSVSFFSRKESKCNLLPQRERGYYSKRSASPKAIFETGDPQSAAIVVKDLFLEKHFQKRVILTLLCLG